MFLLACQQKRDPMACDLLDAQVFMQNRIDCCRSNLPRLPNFGIGNIFMPSVARWRCGRQSNDVTVDYSANVLFCIVCFRTLLCAAPACMCVTALVPVLNEHTRCYFV
uniref:Uncharacterized protein n=1 Tax=Plectus sambesii TaxID=2011161 RepID=A0A914WG16_9BILA